VVGRESAEGEIRTPEAQSATSLLARHAGAPGSRLTGLGYLSLDTTKMMFVFKNIRTRGSGLHVPGGGGKALEVMRRPMSCP
jgi:hypothetical protein